MIRMMKKRTMIMKQLIAVEAFVTIQIPALCGKPKIFLQLVGIKQQVTVRN